MALWQWSKTATSNGTADPTMNWSEGIAPSIVDDNVRALMARAAEYRDDISGSLTLGGTSTAYTLTTNQGLATPTPTTGQLIGFVPNVTNGNAATLAVDGGSVYPIQTATGSAVGAGVLVQGTPYTAMFNGSAWILRNFFGNPFIVPVGAIIDYTGTTAPNSSFVLPFGQAISRTTFATYFALVGTTFGTGDGTTTFNVPDLRGRGRAGLDNMGGTAAGRIGTALVTDSGTINGQSLGSAGGSSTHVQTTAEMAQHAHTATSTVTDPGHGHSVWGTTLQDNSGSRPLVNAPTNTNLGGNLNASNSYVAANNGSQNYIQNSTTGITVATTNANAGSSNAMAWLQPTMMVNCILRVI